MYENFIEKHIASSVRDNGASFAALNVVAAAVEDKAPFDVDALSALLMDSATGEVLYAKNAAEALPPASVTKI